MPRPRDGAWPRTDVDRFVLARIEGRGLRPVGDAERATLIRRLTFDLWGLPPSPAEIDAFVEDGSPDALETLVDRLRASPRVGERQGRHWPDVARFAESSGGGRSLMFANAWRFRDYVMESFNRDVPFDRFVREQIAGDLLPHESAAQRNRQLVATGFLALGPTNYEQQDKELLRMDVIDEQIDTIGRAFLGLTLGCARCHDHKFDPVPTTDYYALAGILGSTELLTPGNVSGWLERDLVEPTTERWNAYQRRYAEVEAELRAARSELGRKSPGKRIERAKLQGIVLDDADATLIGEWKLSTHNQGFLDRGTCTTWTPDVPKAGVYEVRLSYTSGSNRATNVPVRVEAANAARTLRVNQ